jgi:hypothetical protein
MSLDQIVANLDQLSSLSVQLDALPRIENLADASSVKTKIKFIKDEARTNASSIAEAAGILEEPLEIRTAKALVAQALLIRKDIESKAEVILRELEAHSIEIIEKAEEHKEFDFAGAMTPVTDHWASIGKDVKKYDGGVKIQVPGHSIILTGSEIVVECQDQTGLRHLVELVAQEHPFDVAEIASRAKSDWGQFSKETQEVLKKADDISDQRIKAIKKAKKIEAKEKTKKTEEKLEESGPEETS